MPHTAELIAVGTELLLGSIANTDARDISRELSAIGINVYYHTVVGDNPQRLEAAVNTARGRADIIITTGGLGPTCDDLTKQTLAKCFGKKLVFDPHSMDRIVDYFQRLKGRKLTKNNEQQAWLPEGCTVFDNDWGTAPGCAFEAEGIHVVMLPGPPSECRPMFHEKAVPYLKALGEGAIVSRTLKLFGTGESMVEAQLRDRMNAMTNPTLAPYAKEGEVELRMTARADTEEEAEAMLDPVEADLRGRFGRLVYGTDVSSLEEVVLNLLRERDLTISTAESCTGGLAAKRLTDLPGASQVFRGGVVSYTDEVKAEVLGVPQALLDQHGAVSAPVAAAMAEGARRITGSDLAVSTTGVAGPDPDDRGNEVGLVFVALAAEDGTFVKECHLGGTRARIRISAASTALNLARLWLQGLPLEGGDR